jgi:Fibronectin type 3 domain-containing protein
MSKLFKAAITFSAIMVIFIAGSITAFAATVGQPLIASESGWQRIDDSNSNILYSSGWTRYTYSSGYDGSQVATTTQNATATIRFYGTKLRIIYSPNYNNSNNVPISIDGNTDTFSEYAASQTPQVLVYEKTGLTQGVHRVTITAPSSSYTGLDAIDIDENGYMVAPNQPTNLTATPGDASVALSWDVVNSASSYNVYRSTTSDGLNPVKISGITNTNYLDTGLNNGTTYYYVVTAVTSSGEGPKSIEVSATPNSTATGKALLDISLTNGTVREYDVSMQDVNAFIAWYDGREAGKGSSYYTFNVNYNLGSYKSIKDYIAFSKIDYFEVKQYS